MSQREHLGVDKYIFKVSVNDWELKMKYTKEVNCALSLQVFFLETF